MSNRKLLTTALLLSATLTIFSCKKDNQNTGPGRWMFWTNSDIHASSIKVTLYEKGLSGHIYGGYISIPPCGTFDCYTIDLKNLGISDKNRTGSFAYRAVDSVSSADVKVWTGTIEVTEENWQWCNFNLLIR